MNARKNIFRILFTLVSVPLFAFAFVVQVAAVTVSPSTGSFATATTQTFNIVAAPTATGQNAASIRLTVTGMTITGFTDPTGFIGVTADCSGGTKYTATTICVSMAKSSDIVAGNSLGSFTATMGSVGTATVTKSTGNAYSDGTTTVANTGSAGTYTITAATTGGTGTTGTLPNTAFENSNAVLAIVGLTFLSLGVLSYVSLDTYRKLK